MNARPLIVGLAIGLLLAPLVSLTAVAAPPQATAWGTSTVEGLATGLGLIDDGFLVVATDDAGGVPDSASADCAAGDGEDADLFLFSFPDGDGCLQAIDTSDALGQEGTTALAVAPKGARAIVGLPPATSATGASGVNLAAYDLDGQALEEAWRISVPGQVTQVATDHDGDRTVTTTDEDGTYTLTVHDTAGVTTATFDLKGEPMALSLSEDGRLALVGGSFDAGNTTFGYLSLYDLTRSTSDNPVFDREIRQAGSGEVTSASVSTSGAIAAGIRGGRALYVAQPTAPSPTVREATIGTESTTVDLSQDGTRVLAASNGNLTHLAGSQDALRSLWTLPLDQSIQRVAYRAPYLYADTGTVIALDTSGTPLWQTKSGDLATFNHTGRGLAFAAYQSSEDAATQARSQVGGAEVHAQVNMTQADEPTIAPGDIGRLNLTLNNTGSAILNLSLETETPQGIQIETSPERAEILPGQARTFSLIVDVATTADPGPVTIPLTADSRPATNLSANVTVTVGEATDLSLRLQPGTEAERDVVQKQSTRVAFVLGNQGNTQADVDLEVLQVPSKGDTWPVAISSGSSVQVSRGSVTTVLLDVQVPEEAPNGTRNTIVLRATGDGGAQAASITFTVNAFEALDLDPRLRTKLIAPGGTASYGFDLVNLGSIDSNVSLAVQALNEDGEPFVPGGWSLSVHPSSLNLASDATEEVTVEISGPPGATDGDRLRVQLLAQTDQGVRVSSLAFAVVDPALAEEPPEEPKREPLGLIAPIIGLAAAALARRQRVR